MGWFIVALGIGWLCGRNWDAIVKMATEKKHAIQTKSNNSSDTPAS